MVDAFLAEIDAATEIRARFAPPPEEQPVPLPEDKQITLQEAAETLAISPSRLRRWADEGRVPSVRTAGGHRRFSLAAVRRLADESGVRTKVRPVEPPAVPLPLLAECLGPHGRQLTVAAAAAIYREGPPGWFASEPGAAALREWVQALRESSQTGAYGSALRATTTLRQHARRPCSSRTPFSSASARSARARSCAWAPSARRSSVRAACSRRSSGCRWTEGSAL